MRFAPVFASLVALAIATPLPDTPANDIKAALAQDVPFAELIPMSGYAANDNELEARGSTPWHDCACHDSGYITDAWYSDVYSKTLAQSANFQGLPVYQGQIGLWTGPTKFFLTVQVLGKNRQVFSRDRVGNIIHQLKVARGLKGCGTRPVTCWTQGDDAIFAQVREY